MGKLHGLTMGLDVCATFHMGIEPAVLQQATRRIVELGRGRDGRSRWSPDLDHSATTAVCGIHRLGKTPSVASEEVARLVRRMLEARRSGVALGEIS
jgi:hypothetical protein